MTDKTQKSKNLTYVGAFLLLSGIGFGVLYHDHPDFWYYVLSGTAVTLLFVATFFGAVPWRVFKDKPRDPVQTETTD